MENISITKNDFNKILTTVEVLISDVEQVLSQNEIAESRMNDIVLGKVTGKTMNNYNEYLKKRGISL